MGKTEKAQTCFKRVVRNFGRRKKAPSWGQAFMPPVLYDNTLLAAYAAHRLGLEDESHALLQQYETELRKRHAWNSETQDYSKMLARRLGLTDSKLKLQW